MQGDIHQAKILQGNHCRAFLGVNTAAKKEDGHEEAHKAEKSGNPDWMQVPFWSFSHEMWYFSTLPAR